MKLIMKSSGGLGAQVLAIAYCIWLKKFKNKKSILRFTERGVSYRPFVVADLLIDIDLHLINNPIGLKANSSNTGDVSDSSIVRHLNQLRFKLRNLIKRTLQITKVLIYKPNLNLEEVNKTKAWTRFIDGYHADLRVLKEVWPELSRLILRQRSENFILNAGTKNNLSVHWRIGDYGDSEANATHGVISAIGIISQIRSVVNEFPVENILIFSDSITNAKTQLDQIDFGVDVTFIQGDIWSDMIRMAESRFFIGSHSSISILVTFALFDRFPEAVVYLPDKWFKRIPDGFEDGIENCHPKSIFPTVRTFEVTLI
jgi:hypothetical protein